VYGGGGNLTFPPLSSLSIPSLSVSFYGHLDMLTVTFKIFLVFFYSDGNGRVFWLIDVYYRTIVAFFY